MRENLNFTVQIPNSPPIRDISFQFNYGIIQKSTGICRAAANTIMTITVAYEVGCYMPDWEIIDLITGEVIVVPLKIEPPTSRY